MKDLLKKIDWNKNNGLVPAIIQDAETMQVLMLGYMNQEAFNKTIEKGLVTFFSRSKNRLWTKGEESKNFFNLVNMSLDCDNDTLLVYVNPEGPACHNGTVSCFNDLKGEGIGFLGHLNNVIKQRNKERPEGSYTTKLFTKGIDKIAQKVGEEAVETVIASKNDDMDLFLGEASDLVYHLIVLLEAKGSSLKDVAEYLRTRHN